MKLSELDVGDVGEILHVTEQYKEALSVMGFIEVSEVEILNKDQRGIFVENSKKLVLMPESKGELITIK